MGEESPTSGSGAHAPSGSGLFLYDRDCGFCQRAVAFARDRLRTRTAFAAWQDCDLPALGLTPEQTDARAWIVYPDGRRLAGGDAVAGVLLGGGRPARVLGRFLLLPGARVVNRAVYRVVAANRHRLPGGTSSCTLPTAK
ncbi:thiol-disulfide oxidoreductase DCC family protein [Nocardiopsis sp. NPDC006938]|uniref:thiol-disulfide oxidoreductase DCC family protein n=1 Tax=Nocardiopsis sp. NPDC006938 TaxID=3364337 RepID=UPI0036D202FD